MDEVMALDLARQFREHINYTGDTAQFDQQVLALIKVVEDQAARVVEQTPTQLFLVSRPANILSIIAAEVRGATRLAHDNKIQP